MAEPATFDFPRQLETLFPRPLRRRLLELRHDLHRHPELSFAEERTAERLETALAALRPRSLERVAGTGVLARIAGQNPAAPTVAIRGDIDALPIDEATGLPWSSENAGVMHACGHDVHASWAVGAAHLLAASPADGDVLILLQPGEETGQGAPRVLASGALDGVEAIFGAHVDRRFTVGKVIADVGPLAASADVFRVVLRGRGAHGARPHESPDPIVGAAALITALQTIVSRRLDPATAAVVTVGEVHAGAAANVIPEHAALAGTLRAIDPSAREALHAEVRHLAEHVASAHRLEVEVEIELGPPPIVNEPEPIGWARDAVTGVLGAEALVPLGFVNLAGEDFASYLETLTGCFLRIGAREPGGEVIPAHSPRFYAADGAVFVGAAVLAETARVASAALAAS